MGDMSLRCKEGVCNWSGGHGAPREVDRKERGRNGSK